MSNPGAISPELTTTMFWRHRELPQVELWRTPRSDQLLKVVFPGYALTSSSGPPARWMDYRYRAETGRARGTDVCVVEPDELIHQLSSSGPMRVDALMVASEYVREVVHGERSDKPLHLRSNLETNGALYPLVDRVTQSLQDPATDSLEIEHHLLVLIRRAFEIAGEDPPRIPAAGCARAVRRALDFVRCEFASRLTLATIAAEVGVSRGYLERTFAQIVGVPVHQYVQGIRVARALHLMARGSTAADAAAAVGFTDQAHMTTVFRKRMGFTPGQYRCRSRAIETKCVPVPSSSKES